MCEHFQKGNHCVKSCNYNFLVFDLFAIFRSANEHSVDSDLSSCLITSLHPDVQHEGAINSLRWRTEMKAFHRNGI